MKEVKGWRGNDPRNMLIIPTEKVIKVAATTELTVFVTACGRLYSGYYNGKDKGSLKLIDLGSKWVEDVAIYKGLVIFVTEKGSTFSLNLETDTLTTINIFEPKKTCSHGKEERGKKVFIKKLSAGLEHILYLSSKNEIWVQGKGPALGLFTNKTENEITNPTRVDFFKGRQVLQVEAGHYFTIALVDSLSPIQNDPISSYEPLSLTDLDPYVRSCELCRKETGDRVLFEGSEDIERCPLGLGVYKEDSNYLLPSNGSAYLSRRVSSSSSRHDEGDSSDYIPEDFDLTSGDTSCNETTLNTPIELKSGMEMKTISRRRKLSTGSFEVVENNIDGNSSSILNESVLSSSALSITRDAAKQFFSHPLSWVTSASIDADMFGLDYERFNYKYPIDSATELIKENVANAASLVATSVRNVGDKVGLLSRHFSSTEGVEDCQQKFSPDGEALNIEMCSSKPFTNLKKSESFDWNSFPKRGSSSHAKKVHKRTGSGGMCHTLNLKDGLFFMEKNTSQIISNKDAIIELGKNILNCEVWVWGSSNKGQLGLGDHNHRTTPTNITSLNHCGVVKIVCGNYHTAALTIDGQVYVWGSHSGNSGSSSPLLLELPLKRLARDVASGDDFLVIISLDGRIFYCTIKDNIQSQIKEIYIPDPSSSLYSVLCQSQSIVCTTEETDPKVESFVSSESLYLGLLKKSVQHIVLPFRTVCRSKNNSNGDSNGQPLLNGDRNETVQMQIKRTKADLLEAYLSVTYTSTAILNDLKNRFLSEITEILPIIHQVEEFILVYKEYMSVICNALAISGLTLETKDAEAVLEKSKCHFAHLQSENIKNSADIFSYLLLLPIKRIEEYEKLILDLRNDTQSFYSPFSLDKMKVAYSHWKQLAVVARSSKNLIQITVPEETLTLLCPTPVDKGLWLQSLQECIKKSVGNSVHSRSAPLLRSATYSFTKHHLYKEAVYSGHWFCGKLHGEGTLTWPDGKKYIGQFRQNLYQGAGILSVPSGLEGFDIFEGYWKNGKLEGKGIIRYANRNVYVGFLKESQPHGHGELKKGKFSSEAASVYTGEWSCGVKHGYGVLDEIVKGEKYHGMWQNDNHHGPGMVVTMNDVYYEGNFNQNKLTGFGLMILDDGTTYEGELGPGGTCNGKGVLRYPNSDFIEGSFSGSWSEGIKINGILYKGNGICIEQESLPKSFGKFSVAANRKWNAIFKHCEEQLGIVPGVAVDTSKVWQTLASVIEGGKQALLRSKGILLPLDGLDKIPEVPPRELTAELLRGIQQYLENAFSNCLHPLWQLMQSLVGAFRATYGGVVAHPRLLKYAVLEVWSFSSKLYRIVRLLFPALPTEEENIILETEGLANEDLVITSASIIHPWLLPHLYATLSPLYVRHHNRKDEEYWQRLLKWNKQSDIALMTFLGVDRKFWLSKRDELLEKSEALSMIDHNFTEAVETLQLLSTSFTPKDKLLLIHKCGIMINQEVTMKLGNHFVLSMDDLLPLFLYVVVRARIQHLGAEIGLIDDLIDPNLQNGELGHVFTTLKACYFHILHEKPTPGM